MGYLTFIPANPHLRCYCRFCCSMPSDLKSQSRWSDETVNWTSRHRKVDIIIYWNCVLVSLTLCFSFSFFESTRNSAGLIITSPSMMWVRAPPTPPLRPACLCPWARYYVSIASLSWAHQEDFGHWKYYNLSVDMVCTWPMATLKNSFTGSMLEAIWMWRFS